MFEVFFITRILLNVNKPSLMEGLLVFFEAYFAINE